MDSKNQQIDSRKRSDYLLDQFFHQFFGITIIIIIIIIIMKNRCFIHI